MKKEKERNLTLEQLEDKRKMFDAISRVSVVVEIFIVFISLVLASLINEEQKRRILSLYGFLILVLFGLSYFCLKLKDGYTEKIDQIKKQKKVEEMRQLSQNGNLKDFVEIKSEKMKMDILSHVIEKIEIEDFIDKEFSVKVQLKGDKEIFMITFLSKEKLLLLLQDEEKQEILDRLIDNVEVNKTFDEGGNELNRLRISTIKYQYYQGDITDSELLEMLEVKK